MRRVPYHDKVKNTSAAVEMTAANALRALMDPLPVQTFLDSSYRRQPVHIAGVSHLFLHTSHSHPD